MTRLIVCLLFASLPACASELVLGDFKTDLIPHPVPYAVLLPDGYKDGPPLPMLMMLHGAGGSRDQLGQRKDLFDNEWKSGRLPKMVVATITAGPICFYMDFKDGTEKWETLVVGTFREFIHKTYNTSSDPKKNVLMGVSMGGEGTLRLGLKHPESFAAIAALEPGLQPILYWKEMTPRMHFWIDDQDLEVAFGKPVDAAYWEANNPNLIVTLDSKHILDSGLQIYLDVGDDDSLLLFGPVEHFHRILWDAGIKHEYHIVHGADHVGRTMPERVTAAFEFLGRVVNPPAPDWDAVKFKQMVAPLKDKIGIKE
jgi:S-formylglutathione hydrolase